MMFLFRWIYWEFDHVFVGYSCQRSGFRGFTYNTEAIISFYSSYYLIKKCGVRLLFNQEFGEAMKRSRCSIIVEEEAHSKRLKSSNLFKGESSSRENFELGQSKVMSEVEKQVMSNNNVNNCYNKVDGVGVGGVALGSIVQQSHAAAAAGEGNEGWMRHGRGNGHNIVVGNAGGCGRGHRGRGNMQGMGNRGLARPVWNRGPGAVGRRGMIGSGGNGFVQGIRGPPPLMHPHSIGFGPGFGAPLGRMGSYGGFLGAPSPPFSGESSLRLHSNLQIAVDQTTIRMWPQFATTKGCCDLDIAVHHDAGAIDLDRTQHDNAVWAIATEKFELGQSKVTCELEEQVVSNNNNVNRGRVVQGSIVQQSHADGSGHNIFLGNAGRGGGKRGNWGRDNMQGGGYGRGNGGRVNMEGMGNRGPAVDGRGMMGNGGNGFGQGIGKAPPFMHTQSTAFGLGFGAPMGWMGSYGGFLGAPTLPFSGVLSRCSIIDEEEAQSKRSKSSNFFKGESSSSMQLDVKRSGVHLEEGEEFYPSINESNSFTLLGLNKFPQDFVRSYPFTPLDSDEFPQVSVASPVILISDSDEDNDGDFVKSQPFIPLDLNEFPQDSVGSPIIISDSDEHSDG
ncbi:hypothetical protein Patl1_07791 [Pistacia atlantica]|uniref:Uncharacterized protein n=1 Tax=Pistacia atlantica TaxID=434234 RepID=A0ACC1AEU3_9ROSI|nr:hypothetical protein Patl1_07791 [Pistacia atlantica]